MNSLSLHQWFPNSIWTSPSFFQRSNYWSSAGYFPSTVSLLSYAARCFKCWTPEICISTLERLEATVWESLHSVMSVSFPVSRDLCCLSRAVTSPLLTLRCLTFLPRVWHSASPPSAATSCPSALSYTRNTPCPPPPPVDTGGHCGAEAMFFKFSAPEHTHLTRLSEGVAGISIGSVRMLVVVRQSLCTLN